MLHAPVSENKTQDKQGKTQSEPESERRALGWAGYPALGLGGENGSSVGNERARGWQPINLSTLSQGGVLQRKCACGSAAGAAGTCEECQGKEGAMLQTKLSIGSPDDKYEREADRVADEVMRMPESTIQPNVGSEQKGGIQRKAIANSITPLQRSSTAPNQASEAPDIVHDVLRSPGQPLDPATRALMEPRFGHDFSQVRVHTGGDADRSAREVKARAYTVGHNIVFRTEQYVPETSSGKRLLAHELTHALQQRGGMRDRVQRTPGGASTAPTKVLESLEAVAQRIARLAIGPSSLKYAEKFGGADKVVSVVRNVRTGQIYVGLNTGTPVKLTDPIKTAIEEQKRRIALGEITVRHTAVDALGGHAEVNALNSAIADEQAMLGRMMTEAEIATTFEMHNVWLSGKRQLTTASRCEHCASITRGVKVTESLFKSEGGMLGELNVPQRGKAVKIGGKTVEAETIYGEIPTSKSGVKKINTVTNQFPEAIPDGKVPGVPSGGKSMVLVTEIGLNVLLFAVTYYLNKWYEEKQAREFNNDLKGLLPEVNTLLKNKEAEIIEKEKNFPLVYGNITIGYTREGDDYIEGGMSIQDLAISHQNYQTPEKFIKVYNPLIEVYNPLNENNLTHSLTFSVPLFEEKTAEEGASSLVGNYRQVREKLTYPAYKVRLSTVIALYKLTKQDSSLETLVIRDLLGLLKDEDATVRLVAAAFLSRLKAKIPIQYIQEVIPSIRDGNVKESIRRYLRELEQREGSNSGISW
jgi:hypothetical protein